MATNDALGLRIGLDDTQRLERQPTVRDDRDERTDTRETITILERTDYRSDDAREGQLGRQSCLDKTKLPQGDLLQWTLTLRHCLVSNPLLCRVTKHTIDYATAAMVLVPISPARFTDTYLDPAIHLSLWEVK